MTTRFHIDSFEALPRVTRKTKYEEFRAIALRIGRFSAFEATDTPLSAKMFDRLCRDPWIDTDHSCGYPWTKIAARSEPKPEYAETFACAACKREWASGPLPCAHKVMVFKRRDLIPPSESPIAELQRREDCR